MSEFRTIDLPAFVDARGHLTVLQDALPFPIQRVFWIGRADGNTRGGHRHHVTRQALVAVSGTVSIFVDDGRHRQTVVLEQPNRILLVEPDDWHTMTFGPNGLLLVFSSHVYNQNDYIDERY